MRTLNILYCLEYFAHGGTEKQVLALIDGIDKERFMPHVCCLKDAIISKYRREEANKIFDEVRYPKIQLDFSSFRNPGTVKKVFKLAKFIRLHEIDIIQTYSRDSNLIGMIAAKMAGVKCVVACFRDMGFSIKNKKDFIGQLFYKGCSAYIANSNAVKDFYSTLYSLDSDNFDVIYNGIDTDIYSPVPFDKKINISKKKVIGIVANFNRPVKRVDVFLRAAAYVSEHIQNTHFIIAGDGELRHKLIQLSEELGINECVHFAGRVHNVPELLLKLDVGIISSDSEGFSNAILEYMASGVPVVATNVGGNKEIIQDGGNGFLVPSGNSISMGDRIIELLTKKDLYDTIRENALTTINTKYKMEDCIVNYEIFYEQLLSGED